MSWFDMLMTTVQSNRELLKETDWRNIENWTPRYDESGHSNRWNFILNEHIKDFAVGKSYKVNVEFTDDTDIPQNLYYLERRVVDDVWELIKRTYFTQSPSSGILTKEETFAVVDGVYYMFWTNRPKSEMESWLNKIKSITVTEV